MNYQLIGDMEATLNAGIFPVALTITVPIMRGTTDENLLKHSLQIAGEIAERYLIENNPEDALDNISAKLLKLAQAKEMPPGTRGAAIFISSGFDKIIFLTVPTKIKIVVDNSFAISDLLKNQKQSHKFLLLTISGNESTHYLFENNNLTKVDSGRTTNAGAFAFDAPEKVSNFSDMSHRKEILLKKHLLHIDKVLHQILKEYPLPLFILATERVAGHFRQITKHQHAIAGYLSGNYDNASIHELKKRAGPLIEQWHLRRQQNNLVRLAAAVNEGRVATGIEDVSRQAKRGNAFTMIVEENYLGTLNNLNTTPDKTASIACGPRDAVDKLAETILRKGGHVEFVSDGLLKEYEHIALILYYSQ